MSKHKLMKWVSVAARIVLAVMLVSVQGAWAAQNSQSQTQSKAVSAQGGDKLPAPTQSASVTVRGAIQPAAQSAVLESQSPARGAQEGIKVHGHWTIEVRNPDGSVATHREFENALFPSPALASILGRQVSVGFWSIAVFPGTICGYTNNAPCSIYEPGIIGYAVASTNLSVTVAGNNLVFAGTFLAAGGGTIATVQTDSYGCLATVAPSTPCQPGNASPVNFGFGPGGGFIFTSRDFDGLSGDPQPISVNAGQTVAVTVTISFS
jgi:hypothetical protein